MNEKEAKNMLETRLKCLELDYDIEGCDGDCNVCEYCYTQGTIGEQKESLKMAIKALEKQIPKKVIIVEGEFLTVARCPVCGDCLGFHEPYCSGCGNAVDWSEEE